MAMTSEPAKRAVLTILPFVADVRLCREDVIPTFGDIIDTETNLPGLLNALDAVLLFERYRDGGNDELSDDLWRKLTGTPEPSFYNLCKCVRRELRKARKGTE